MGCYGLTGTADLSLAVGVLLTGDPIFGDVIVRGDGSMPHLYQGMPITVYYNGVMALSYPGQVTASHIVVPELTGTVSDRDSAGFTLTDADGNEYRVLLSEQTFAGVLSASVEEAPAAEEPAAEEPAQDEPAKALDDAEDEPLSPDGEEESPALPTVEWGDGDTVTVYYNGVMTRSLPPQVTALEVLVFRQ